jgi:PLP dependent protein
MQSIAKRIALLLATVNATEEDYHRPKNSVTIVAVSKSKSALEIAAAVNAGLSNIGESYLQEALEKIKTLNNPAIIWHYIGKIQYKKIKALANNFAWVQTVDSYDHALGLSKHRPTTLPPLNICIQVNISNEATKAGVIPEAIIPLATQIRDLPNLRLRGLMAIPKMLAHFDEQLATFQKMADEFRKLQAAGFNVDTLSMGMSNDYHAAIAAGSTMVRIGTAIFGNRHVEFGLDDESLIEASRIDIAQNITNRVCTMPEKETSHEDGDDTIFKSKKEEFRLTEADLINVEKVLRENKLLDKKFFTVKERQEIINRYGAMYARHYAKDNTFTLDLKENLTHLCLHEKNLLDKKVLEHALTSEQVLTSMKLMQELKGKYQDNNNPQHNHIIKNNILLLAVLNNRLNATMSGELRQRLIDTINRTLTNQSTKIETAHGDQLGLQMQAIMRQLQGVMSTNRLNNLLSDLSLQAVQNNKLLPHFNPIPRPW